MFLALLGSNDFLFFFMYYACISTFFLNDSMKVKGNGRNPNITGGKKYCD
jgi:hypothetical protein